MQWREFNIRFKHIDFARTMVTTIVTILLGPLNLIAPVQAQDHYRPNPLYPLSGTPATLESVTGWVLATHDHFGMPFLVADKTEGMIYKLDAHGQIVDQSPALFGKYIGDEALHGQTPAGAFTLRRHRTKEVGYGGDVLFFWSEEGVDYALHRTYLQNPKERRAQRLVSETPADNRISDGCINVPPSFYNGALSGASGMRLYILPEQTSVYTSEHRGLMAGYEYDGVVDFRPF